MSQQENKEAYVSLSVAKELKSIGFDFPVRSFYQEPLPGTELERIFNENPEEHTVLERHDMPFGWENWNHKDAPPKDRVYYSCPTLAVAQRWFREVKGIAVLVGYDVETDNCFRPIKMVYTSDLRSIAMNGICYSYERRTADTYEEALESAILLAIMLIKERGEL